MIIEESIVIHTAPEKVWNTFTDISSWKSWNTVLTDVTPYGGEMIQGRRIRLFISLFGLPVSVGLEIEEIIPGKRIVWSGEIFGISARHEFVFEKCGDGIIVISRETFRAIGLRMLRLLFPDSRIRELTLALLKDLKAASER